MTSQMKGFVCFEGATANVKTVKTKSALLKVYSVIFLPKILMIILINIIIS